MQTSHIARRSVAFFVVTSAPNFFSLIFVGIDVFVGIVPGLPSAVLTLVPAIITALGVVIVAGSPRLLRRLGKPDPVPAPSGWGRTRFSRRPDRVDDDRRRR
jgi:Ca2+/Na+ antiporter